MNLEKGLSTEENTPIVAGRISTTSPEAGQLATAHLVFPLKSIPSVVAGLPKTYIPLCGPETLSCY